MATFSSNTTIKINAIGAGSTTSVNSTLTYTVPSNCYAILSYSLLSPASAGFGSVDIDVGNGRVTFYQGTANALRTDTIYLAAGSVFRISTGNGGNAIYNVVSFINSP